MELDFLPSTITAFATGVVSWLVYRLQKREAKFEEVTQNMERQRELRDKALFNALIALCRDRIVQGYRYHRKKGTISTQDLKTMTDLYQAYHDLGGNGTVTKVYEKICGLPLKEE